MEIVNYEYITSVFPRPLSDDARKELENILRVLMAQYENAVREDSRMYASRYFHAAKWLQDYIEL